MKSILPKFYFLCFLLLGFTALQAQLDLPQPSPSASVMYTVGMTEISIEYSSPGVKGRTIWGDLVAYDEVWRTGANASTKITFSDAVKIGGTDVDAGTYSLFTIPGKTEWTIIINKNIELWGSDGYEQSDDVVRIKTKARKTASKVERMQFGISSKGEKANVGEVCLQWDEMMLAFDVEVDVMAQAEAAIDAKLKEADMKWRYLMQAATFYKDNGDLDKALSSVNESIAINEYYYSYYLQAMILAEKKDFKGAVKAAQKALEVGEKHEEPFKARFLNYKESIEKSLAEWKKG